MKSPEKFIKHTVGQPALNPDYVVHLEEVVKAVAHIGVDWGYGKYELEDKFIDQARVLHESNDSVHEPILTIARK